MKLAEPSNIASWQPPEGLTDAGSRSLQKTKEETRPLSSPQLFSFLNREN
jgi:hypothetical protein